MSKTHLKILSWTAYLTLGASLGVVCKGSIWQIAAFCVLILIYGASEKLRVEFLDTSSTDIILP